MSGNTIKQITGTWFEFQHHSEAEGKYWNDTCKEFTDEQWKEKVREIAACGMKYIVLMNTAIVRENNQYAYFETDIFPFSDIAAKDPIGALLSVADEVGIKVFISCGFYGSWRRPADNISSPEVSARTYKAMKQLFCKYGGHTSFYGWYLPDETCIIGHFAAGFIAYVNRIAAFSDQISPGMKILIAPYGTKLAVTDRKFVSQLKEMNADFIAYQDEVGVKKSTVKQTARYFSKLRKAHDKAGKSALWADIELFDFEGFVYKSALIPASSDRIEKQIESVSPYVDEILCYQYIGILNQENSKAFCGHPLSVRLYKALFGKL